MKKIIDNVVKGIVGIGLMFNLGCGKIEPAKGSFQKPTYLMITRDFVGFEDNYAPTMKAYIKSKNFTEPIELIADNRSDEIYFFKIPEEILNEGNFSIRAIDRDGNESIEESFYTEGSFLIRR